jgi:hypothetical protein
MMMFKKRGLCQFVVLALVILARPQIAMAQSYILPSSAYRTGANAAEYHSDVRILNQATSAVTVTATFYDQQTSTTFAASPFQIAGRSQAAFDNILQSLFGRQLSQGAYGPIRFDATGPILVNSNVNNVNACGTGAVSGQWLPGIIATKALAAGVIGELAASASAATGYRTNLVFMNPGTVPATATVNVRQGGGTLLATATIGPLAPNGFTQVALGSPVFPAVAGTTDTNLWVDFTSNQPVLAYATMINNTSGDPYAVVAVADTPPGANPFNGNYFGSFTGTQSGTWSGSISLAGTVTLTVGTYSGGGAISASGALSATASGSLSGVNITVTWHGSFQLNGTEAIGSGTWTSTTGDSGTWSGSRM